MIESIIFRVEGDAEFHDLQQSVQFAVAARLDHACPTPGIISIRGVTELGRPVYKEPPTTLRAVFKDGASTVSIQEDAGLRQ
jgi:hypothetical protein